MFGLAEGFLEVEITLDNQEIIKVGPIVPGEVFGEMSMLADEPRTATVTAAVDSVAFEITREAFSKIVAKRPETAVKVSRVIAERLLTAQRIEASAAEAAERESAIGETAENLFSRMKSVFTSLGLK
jgi:CRP-like cAMP-binding protein